MLEVGFSMGFYLGPGAKSSAQQVTFAIFVLVIPVLYLLAMAFLCRLAMLGPRAMVWLQKESQEEKRRCDDLTESL